MKILRQPFQTITTRGREIVGFYAQFVSDIYDDVFSNSRYENRPTAMRHLGVVSKGAKKRKAEDDDKES
jgi:hypothetical protein